MRSFKDFLKNEAMGAGINPTLTAGHDWKFPTSTHALPTSFHGVAQKFNRYAKPEFAALSKIQYLVQNIASEPQLYGNNVQITGTPQTGGFINGLDYQRMISTGASRGAKFLPAEFNYAQESGIFIMNNTVPQTVTINLGTLYKKMKSEIDSILRIHLIRVPVIQFIILIQSM